MATFLCLDCQWLKPTQSEGGTGYAVLRGAEANHVVCYVCSDARERRDMATHDDMFAYLSSDKRTITTWPGGELARVTRCDKRMVGFGFEGRYYLRATAFDGSFWYGTSKGPGMYARLHRAKRAA